VTRSTAAFGEARIRPYLAAWEVSRFLEAAAAEIAALRTDLGAYLERTLEGFGDHAYAELERLTDDLPAAVRDDIRAHYIGFPYWDAATYPARALSEVGELDNVEVVRVSPLDTHRLTNAGEHKLRGVALGHFGAFFRRSWRENDYLWGRLDGAERLLWLIGDTSDEAAKEAFAAIAEEERRGLHTAGGLIDRVEAYVGQTVPPAARGPLSLP